MPLSLSEYNILAQKLQQEHLRPADLIAPDGKARIFDGINGSLDPQRIVHLLERGAMLAVAVENWTSKGVWILSRSDEAYPQRLKRKLKHLSPPVLYGIGNPDLLSEGGLAIVGSRDIDDEGLGYTQRIAEKCAEQGIQIVSGGARGVDQTAMLAAISAGGNSVGVLADSLIKAAVSMKYREGLRQGRVALISPYDPSAGFNAGNAMSRNKHVYALADQALVVNSAYEKGGTWAGAKEALKNESKIPVWVRLEGSIPEGNRQLVKLGAIPFPLEPWNRSILSLLEEAEQFYRIEAKKNTSKQLDLSEVEQPETQVDVLTDQDHQSDAITHQDYVTPQDEEHVPQLPKNAYEAVLPLLLHYLSEPKGDKEVADLLDVGVGQVRIWLKKAIQDKFVEKKKTSYILNRKNQQLRLLGGN
ncbi:MAG: DNA-protecting protein DprA [Leptolyngbya sp. Prado105]|jgi:predicted Rossmann fold nucleotide-binding protein DprA/Smf involved in DNA uptake|nr:DNA-protecting protein DprA [Leptolyngbya sp. Prado105]